jgi:hypothetical protein
LREQGHQLGHPERYRQKGPFALGILRDQVEQFAEGVDRRAAQFIGRTGPRTSIEAGDDGLRDIADIDRLKTGPPANERHEG